MELSTAAARLWHHRDVERALIASGDHSPRTASELVNDVLGRRPAFGWNDTAAAYWVRADASTCRALGVTEEEAAALDDLTYVQVYALLAGDPLPVEMTEEEAQEAADELEAAEERRINRAAGGMGCL